MRLDCYKLDGTKLWRIDLGPNIRAGAHYTQFMVYDFDGDGRAEMMCKTAPGSKDGMGKYVNQAATDATIKGHENDKVYRVTSGSHPGHVLSGPEYLTVFSGMTGEALHTTWYLPGRAGTGSKLPSPADSGATTMEAALNAIWLPWPTSTVPTRTHAVFSAVATTLRLTFGRLASTALACTLSGCTLRPMAYLR